MYRKAFIITVLSLALFISIAPTPVYAQHGVFECQWTDGGFDPHCRPNGLTATCDSTYLTDADLCARHETSELCGDAVEQCVAGPLTPTEEPEVPAEPEEEPEVPAEPDDEPEDAFTGGAGGTFECIWGAWGFPPYCRPFGLATDCEPTYLTDADLCARHETSELCGDAVEQCVPGPLTPAEEPEVPAEPDDEPEDAFTGGDESDPAFTGDDPGSADADANGGVSPHIDNPLGFETITEVIEAVVKFLIAAAGAILVVIILFGAFQIMTAAGNPENIKKGRNTIVWALLGFAIILVASGLGSIIANILEVEVGTLDDGASIATSTVDTPEGVIGVIDTIARWMYGILMILGVVFILYSAFLFMTSSGNQEKVSTARRALIYAIVALVIGVLAWGAESLVMNLLQASTSNPEETEAQLDPNQCLQDCMDGTDPATLPAGTNIGVYCQSVCP